ncbi:MAG: 16S rRNA (cytosine(967)-C(5))-methyltransferase, partial [Lachnospiraceae bacterium]|nr:16S rRNA (cytosine(967)-C(5))-methyltransferase [Lachnospiraceae bacterium]
MCEASVKEPETSIRINLSKASAKEVEESLKKDGVTVTKGTYLSCIRKISGYDTLDRLEAFKKGWIQVQDES